jgi:hypothetical protein
MTEQAVIPSGLGIELDALANPSLRAGEKIGDVRILTARENLIELQLPAELGWGRALIGLVPVLWCALAWLMCLKEGFEHKRVQGCLTLSAIALAAVVVMLSSMGVVWRFDGRRKQITRRVSLWSKRHNARRFAGLSVEATPASAFADVHLNMGVVDATGKVVLDIAQWNRREIDRAKVDALCTELRRIMGW